MFGDGQFPFAALAGGGTTFIGNHQAPFGAAVLVRAVDLLFGVVAVARQSTVLVGSPQQAR